MQVSNLLMELLKGYQPLNLDSSSKIPAASWKDHQEEGYVVVRGNELLTGILDKSQFGASAYGLVHATYELYGSRKAGELLSALGRLFTFYLNTVAFTCGIDDMLINVRIPFCSHKCNVARRLVVCACRVPTLSYVCAGRVGQRATRPAAQGQQQRLRGGL
jgi:hypothetical protein